MLRFFIDRPIFASVISVIIMLAGLAALRQLPIEQYPDVVPPQIVVTAKYPGASADVLAQSVAAPLEQEINGVDGMIYMESTSADSGSLQLVVSFDTGTDPDQATIDVNNRVQAALPRLPRVVRDMGVRVQARSSDVLMIGVLTSPNKSLTMLDISNYALLNLLDELIRVKGVGDASLFGLQDYSMRIWLDPAKLARYGLSPADVTNALRDQNAEFAAGRIGANPVPDNQAFTYTVTMDGQLTTPEQFRQILLRTDEHGASLRLGDVARVELGSEDYSFSGTYDGAPTVPFRIYLQPGANAMDTAERVHAALAEVAGQFPAGLEYQVAYDTTEFVRVSIREVIITLVVAMLLVSLVTYLFLQHVRAALIPLAAIPVSLLGTFAGMQALGFSVNMLTLFGLVLAIGVVVDNAIIVMENVERLMAEKGLTARDSAFQTVQQVSGAVVASTLVLVAVFLPVAFLSGLSGGLYRQFAITIAISVVISGLVALTLTPVMCALLLNKNAGPVSKPFQWFNSAFDGITRGFTRLVAWLIGHWRWGLAMLLACYAGTWLLMEQLPSGLVPAEDQGVARVISYLPPAASLARTEAVRDEISKQVLSLEEVDGYISFAGFDLVNGAMRTNALGGFIKLTDWADRSEPGQSAWDVANKVRQIGAQIPEANVRSFTPPPIMGLSLTGGVEGYVQVRGAADAHSLAGLAAGLRSSSAIRPELGNVNVLFEPRVPRYHADMDRDKAKAMGVSVTDIFTSLEATFGAKYVNDFSFKGRLWRVNVQSEGNYRNEPADLRHIFVRNMRGDMVPLSSLVTLKREAGADILHRFNGYPALRVMANPAPGYTSSQAKAVLEQLVADLPPTGQDVRIGWIGEAYQLDQATGSGTSAFVMGIVMVLLILAAQYERLSLPVAVITAVPFGVLGGVLTTMARGFPNDLYFQVGLLVLVGLAAKNAILIVEFAAQNRAAGMTSTEAAITSVRQRLRAILMTALTFIIGSLPLMFATGAGAASRQEIGTVVVGGMLAASSVALLFVPLAYKLLEDLSCYRLGACGREV